MATTFCHSPASASENRARAETPGGVDDSVETAQLVDRLANDLLAVLGPSHVAGQSYATFTGGSNGVGKRLGPAGGERHPGAGNCCSHPCRSPDTGRGPDDEDSTTARSAGPGTGLPTRLRSDANHRRPEHGPNHDHAHHAETDGGRRSVGRQSSSAGNG